MKKIHRVKTHSATQITTQYSVQGQSVQFPIGWQLEGFNFQFFSKSFSVLGFFSPVILEDIFI